jgi:hypothetical protein
MEYEKTGMESPLLSDLSLYSLFTAALFDCIRDGTLVSEVGWLVFMAFRRKMCLQCNEHRST